MRIEQVFAALRFDPLLPVWLLAVLGVLGLAVLAAGFWRRAAGVVWRLACFALILGWLSGPRLVQETWETLSDIALLVVDQSASMQIGHRAALAEQARARLEAEAGAFKDLEIRTVTVPEAGNAGTQLFAGIERALSGIPRGRLAGLVMLTDGQVHDAPTALPPGVPMHVLIPARGEETDRRLRLIEAPGFGIVGKSVTLRLAVDDLGAARVGGPARLTIRRDGEPSQTVTLPIGQEQRIEVPITRAGPTVLDLAVDDLPGEVSTINNRAVVEINGVRDRLRVLLVSGEPHQGERTWRRLLKADPAVDLVHFTILRPPEKDDMTPLNELALIAFPVRELFQVKLHEFDLIILDRFQNRGLLPQMYLRNIADYVKNGGALLMSVGPEFVGMTSLASTPLGAALPARPDNAGVAMGSFRPIVTPLGSRHPVTAALEGANDPARRDSQPQWGSWNRYVSAGDVRGDVALATPEGAPLLILAHEEKGRAALLLSDQIWLWSRGHQGGGPQAEVRRRVAHWLMKQPELEENALTARAMKGQLHIERRSLAEGPPPALRLTAPAGTASTLPMAEAGPGRAIASVAAALPGVWQVSDGTRSAFAAVGASNPLELADLRASEAILAKPVRASGGGAYLIEGSNGQADVPRVRRTEIGGQASGASWMGLPRRHDHIVTGITAVSLLPPWLALPLIMGLALLAWRCEGA